MYKTVLKDLRAKEISTESVDKYLSMELDWISCRTRSGSKTQPSKNCRKSWSMWRTSSSSRKRSCTSIKTKMSRNPLENSKKNLKPSKKNWSWPKKPPKKDKNLHWNSTVISLNLKKLCANKTTSTTRGWEQKRPNGVVLLVVAAV